MKSPIVMAALILAVAAIVSMSIYMFPTYRCIASGDDPIIFCLHGRPGTHY